MLEFDETKLLVDSLFQDQNNFNSVTMALENELFNENGAYINADCILFTHRHSDHYGCRLVKKYMEKNPRTVLAAPEDVIAMGDSAGCDVYHSRTVTCFKNKKGIVTVGGVEVHYYKTEHLDFGIYGSGIHYSFLIKKKDKKIFISGDAAINNTLLDIISSYGELSAAFLNPVVLQSNKGRCTIQKINTNNIFIYHLPLKKYDRYYYRQSSEQMFEKHRGELQNVRLLLGEIENVFLL